MAAAPYIMMGAGGLLQAGGMISGANAEANAAEKDAQFKLGQADEIERRAKLKTGQMEVEGEKIKGSQVAGYGASGFDLSGSPLLVLEETAHNVSTEIAQMNQDSAWKAKQLRAGAEVSMDLASDKRTAGYIGAGGSILGLAGGFMKGK